MSDILNEQNISPFVFRGVTIQKYEPRTPEADQCILLRNELEEKVIEALLPLSSWPSSLIDELANMDTDSELYIEIRTAIQKVMTREEIIAWITLRTLYLDHDVQLGRTNFLRVVANR